jgi:hypothetical protein
MRRKGTEKCCQYNFRFSFLRFWASFHPSYWFGKIISFLYTPLRRKKLYLPRFYKLTKNVMEELVRQLKELTDNFHTNAAAQLENGNKAAGARARKVSLEIEKQLKQFRKVSLEEGKK